MKKIIPIASGKGGVGKTVIAANLGTALALSGKTVILIDLDLGGSNLHTCLGIKNRYPGIGNIIYKSEASLESILLESGTPRLYFIPGDSLLPGTANLNYFTKLKLIKSIHQLTADFIILDLASGSSFNTIDFFLISSSGLIITIPEATAVLNAYSFLKSALFRLIYRSFPPKSEERQTILNMLSKRIEGTELSFRNLTNSLKKISPDSGIIVKRTLDDFRPRVILNMSKNSGDIHLGRKLREIVNKNLNITMEFIGIMPNSDAVSRSILKREPLYLSDPGCKFSRSVDSIAENLISSGNTIHQPVYGGYEDLEILKRFFNTL